MILSFDPGFSGAWAVLDMSGNLQVVGDMPVIGDGSRKRVNAAAIGHLIGQHDITRIVIEEVASRPGEGVSSSFRFGMAVGAVEGACGAMQMPLERVTPQAWKKHFRLPGKANGGEEAARQKAIERWPALAADFARKKDHGRADAALIGLWIVEARKLQSNSTEN